MTTANIVSAWQDANGAHLAVTVVEAGGKVEYIGTVDNATFNTLPDAPTKKAALVAAAKSARDAQQGVASGAIGGISGTVTV